MTDPTAPHAGTLTAADRAQAAGPCITCLLVSGALLAAVVASFVYLKLDFVGLFDADSMRSMRSFTAEFLAPDVSAPFLARTAWATLQTLAVSAIGTLLAGLAGAVLALPAAGRFGAPARQLARLLLNALRSVPELVWAALMVMAAGLGPFAGTLALALHTTGVFGRLYAETLENAPRGPERALLDAGSGRVAAFAYATLPLALPQWIAYGLYRWEMNIRMAAVLGFVGAGGLGQMLYYHLSLFQQAQAATVLLAMFALVVAVDSVSAHVRRGLAPAYA
ncbi:MAG: phosphonate ABC transporter, permease protein PhnE [Burkholderiales bacterium]|nr:phosphonate ABC transporter, permease protein PhnE [Burkholderiales bacterium]